MRDRHGRIWVGTVGGAAFYEPGSERPDQVAKRLLLRGRLLPEGRLLESGERLSYRSSSIRFDYTLLSFFREETSAYRSRLVGLEAQPTSWGNESAREFVHLPAGNYRFQAWGRDYAGNVTGPVEIAFAIRPAPWQTLWARLALLVLIAGLVDLIVRHRSRRHARRERELTEQVEARTRQLHEANRALMKALLRRSGHLGRQPAAIRRALEHEWRRAERMRIPPALIMIDVDRFKEFNDTYGHQRATRSCARWPRAERWSEAERRPPWPLRRRGVRSHPPRHQPRRRRAGCRTAAAADQTAGDRARRFPSRRT